MATPNQEKYRYVSEKIRAGVVLVQLDARLPGVKVPGFLKDDAMLRLNFNHPRPNSDLVINSWGVRETLSFKGSWFPVSIPWSAVYIAHQPPEDFKIFPEDMPEELIEQAMAQMQRLGHSLAELEEKRPRPVWRTRPPEESSASAEASGEVPPAPTPETVGARRGHLRLVK